MSPAERRIYRGLARREKPGWILGLTPPQALGCTAVAAPVPWALASGALVDALLLAVAAVLVIALIAVPVRGRPAARWLWHLMRYRLGVATGWSSWQSAAAAGAPVDPAQPDLPGVLTRLRFPEGPPLASSGRVCLIHDTVEARWGATARLTHRGVGMLSDEQCDRLADRLGTLLLSIGHRDVIDRLSLVVRAAPDDATDYIVWRIRHQVPDAPTLVRQATDELDSTVGIASVRPEVFVTVSGREDKLRKPAAAAGGGVAGRARVLYRVLDGLDDALKTLGVDSVEWLSGPGLAEAIRTGFNPAASGSLRAAHLFHLPTTDSGLALAAAGPTRAPSPQPRSYTHDGFTTVSYTVLIPEAGTVFGSLAPLLAVQTPGERRSLALHYEILDTKRAARTVRGDRFRAAVLRDAKASRGFAATAVDQRDASTARAQEHAVAAGHALVRYAVACAVTVPQHWTVEDHASRLENDASGRFRLLRLELAQDTGFVAACLPLGIGLPRHRAGLL